MESSFPSVIEAHSSKISNSWKLSYPRRITNDKTSTPSTTKTLKTSCKHAFLCVVRQLMVTHTYICLGRVMLIMFQAAHTLASFVSIVTALAAYNPPPPDRVAKLELITGERTLRHLKGSQSWLRHAGIHQSSDPRFHRRPRHHRLHRRLLHDLLPLVLSSLAPNPFPSTTG